MNSIPQEERQAVHDAAEWLASTSMDKRPRPIVPAMRTQFDLSAPEAIRAIRAACLIQARAH